MTQQDTTDWYPSRIHPVRVGYYQRYYGDPNGLDKQPDYWDGARWLVCDQDGRAFRTRAGDFVSIAHLSWRGLRMRPQE